MLPSRLPRHVVMVLLLACTACPGALEDPARFETSGADAGRVEENHAEATSPSPQCLDVPTAVFVPKCASGGCHSVADKAGGLDLQSTNVASRLVGVCASGGGNLIDPASSAESVLYTKLTSNPPFGARMPFGQPLDDATLACVLDWVAAQSGTASSCDRGGR